jgi:glutamyl-tRNA synthetase
MPGPRVRFAPSPTGYLHIGGARTALFNWLYTRRFGGAFILRIEDTDRERSTEASVKAILDGLRWLNLDWDEGPEKGGAFGPYFQTERLALYRDTCDALVAAGKAYRCYCTPEELKARRQAAEKAGGKYKYERTCRDRKTPGSGPSVIRFKTPDGDGQVTFHDRVLGSITKTYADLDDWVMLRGDGVPLYNLGCVVDDHGMQVTLVCRGQEHVNSTFPQLCLYEALEWKPPDFAHLPLILAADGGKISKRKHKEADLMEHARNGILPEALLNFIVRLGWSHGDEEVISREQMLQWFDFDHVGAVNGIWNPEKLLWLNQKYLMAMDPKVLAERWRPFVEEKGHRPSPERLAGVGKLLAPRAKTLREMADVSGYFFSSGVTVDAKAAAKHLGADSKALLQQARAQLAALPHWGQADIDGVVKAVAEKAGAGMGKVAQPIRVAVTGGTASPGLGETLELIERDEVLGRIDAALA